MSEGGRRVVAISFAAFLVMLSIGTVSGHEQKHTMSSWLLMGQCLQTSLTVILSKGMPSFFV